MNLKLHANKLIIVQQNYTY